MRSNKNIAAYIIGLVLLVALVSFAYHFRKNLTNVLVPFLMAMVIAYILQPIVIRMERKNISRRAAILLIYLLFALFTATIIIFIIPEFVSNTKELMITLPEISNKYERMFNNFIYTIRSSNWSPEVKDAIFRQIQSGVVIAQEYIAEGLKRALDTLIDALTILFNTILAMIIAYYILKDGDFFREFALSLTPRKWRNSIIGTGRDISIILSSFIQGQLLTALIVGTMETIGLLIVGVKYPLVLGLVGGIANIIPYFGPFLGAIPAVAVALIDSPIKALWTVAVFVIVQQIDNSFISPKIIEGRLGLHPVTTILAVLIGGEFFGIIGMLVSVPVMAVVKVILKRIVEAIV